MHDSDLAELQEFVNAFMPTNGRVLFAELCADLKAAREVVKAAEEWQRVYQSETADNMYIASRERARLSLAIDAHRARSK